MASGSTGSVVTAYGQTLVVSVVSSEDVCSRRRRRPAGVPASAIVTVPRLFRRLRHSWHTSSGRAVEVSEP